MFIKNRLRLTHHVAFFRTALFSVLVALTPLTSAMADCINPAGVTGELVYNQTCRVPQFCSATSQWMTMSPIAIDSAINWASSTQGKVTASDGAAGDRLGMFVDIDGDTAIVGASYDDSNRGSAYIFVRSGATWVQQAKLTASDRAVDDHFGAAVSVDGNTAVVGAYGDDSNRGAGYVYVRAGSIWTEQAKLTASDRAASDQLGISVSLDGETALLGANGKSSGRGAAYVFARSGSTWSQQTKLTAADSAVSDNYGFSVSVDSNTALIGSGGDDDNGSNSGSAYIYKRSGTSWSQEAKIKPADGASNDFFGYTVSLNDDTALVSSYGDNSDRGAAYVFTRTGTVWTEQTKLTAADGASGDYFGYGISVNGGTAVITSRYDDDNGADSGSAYVFTGSGDTWIEEGKLTASDGAASDQFGRSAAVDGNTVIAGALNDDDNGADSGSAYFFEAGLDYSCP